jgi:cell division initiation protein
MNIGPVDIRNHVFQQKKVRGVDEGEVRAYLDLVADRLEEVVLESEDLRGRIDRLERELEEYRRLERSMRDSLISAEKMIDQRLNHAEQEGQIVLKNAEIEGEKIVLRAREEAGRLRGELDDLRRQRINYVERFRALLRSQEKILEASIEAFDGEIAGARATDAARAADEVASAVFATPDPDPAPSSGPPPSSSPTPAPPAATPSADTGPAPNPWDARPSSGSIPAPTRPESGETAGVRNEPLESYLGEEGLFSGSPPTSEDSPDRRPDRPFD